MILYLDTSALVKLFVVEAHSDRIRLAISGARLVATHAIAYVEACAAFARLAHARGDDALFPALRRNLDIQWEAWEMTHGMTHERVLFYEGMALIGTARFEAGKPHANHPIVHLFWYAALTFIRSSTRVPK